MNSRPDLHKSLDSETFLSFYYLKEELVAFCKANGLPISGGKIELTERIAHYLDTGEILSAVCISKPKTDVGLIEENTLIEPNFICTEKHRTFFRHRIGKGFSFNVAFQKWLKNNAGKTYEQAIAAYHDIMEDKKKVKTTIDRQFEYNTYIRAFFDDNKGRSLQDAIQCWKHKKGLPGSNQYEKSDLAALTADTHEAKK